MEQHRQPRGAWGALLVAALLHAVGGYLLFSSQTLQFSHSSAVRSSAEKGVAVTLMATAAAPAPPTPTPTPTSSPPAPPKTAVAPARPPVATTHRSELPLPPVVAAGPTVASTTPSSTPPSAAPPATTEPTPSRRDAEPAAAAPSAQSEVPTLAGAADASSEALRCSIPQPPYPPRAKRLRQAGTVTLRLTVTTTGAVTGAEVARTSGSESLDQAALDAVTTAKCKPGITDGVASAVVVAIPVRFSLLN